ncbi:predicted protein [Streptomyces sp. AA4]|nr:predicted protein [Streptomyces sp. AA4]
MALIRPASAWTPDSSASRPGTRGAARPPFSAVASHGRPNAAKPKSATRAATVRFRQDSTCRTPANRRYLRCPDLRD